MKKIRLDTAQSEIRATVAKGLATALITGIDQAEQEEHKLTQLQQIDLATMAIMSYEEAIEACDNMNIWHVLERDAENK